MAKREKNKVKIAVGCKKKIACYGKI